MKKIFILWASLFLFIGCAPIKYKKNQSSLIIIKTPKLKFADLGYIRKNANNVRADLFVAGRLVESIKIDAMVCVKDGCLSKASFNAEYLSKDYPDNLLLNVLLARPIFNSEFLKRRADGFVQNIKSSKYDIVYKVQNQNIYFKDRKNNFLIKISKVKG